MDNKRCAKKSIELPKDGKWRLRKTSIQNVRNAKTKRNLKEDD